MRRLLPLLLCLLATAANAVALEECVDAEVNVTLASGVEYQAATVLRVLTDSDRIRVRLSGGRVRTLDLVDVASITRSGEVVFAGQGPAPGMAGQEPDADDSQQRPRRKLSREQRRAAAEEAAKKRADVARRNWLARLAANSVKAWPEATDRDHAAAIARYKQTAAEAQRLMPSLRLYETKQFLFYSNIPADDVGPLVQRLDQMHDWMRRTYNLPPDARVWLGKAPVYAFLEREQFTAFERQLFKNDPQPGTYGLCHQSSSGEVVITCYRGQQINEFACMLVHETSHGFIHRYKTMQSLPSWVNEGMADYIGALMTPQARAVPLREARLLARLKQDPVIRRSFFEDGHISFEDYGLASSLARFMIDANADQYAAFIEAMKAGLSWDDALREAFHAEPADLINAFGRKLGVAGLRVE